MLSDTLIYLTRHEPTSFIECSEKEAKDYFIETFNKKWEDTIQVVIDEYYQYDDEDEEEDIEEFKECNPNPISKVIDTEKGFRVIFEPMYILDNYGDRAYTYEPSKCLKEVIRLVKEKYHTAEINVQIQYEWSDTHCGDCESYSIGEVSLSDDLKAFIGNAIDLSISDGCLEELDDFEDDEIESIKEEFLFYQDYISEQSLEEILNL